MKKIIYSVIAISLLMTSCINRDENVEDAIDPSTHPVLTITPLDPTVNGSTTNEGDALSIPFSVTISKALKYPLNISARQIGGTADGDDYTFSSAVIPAYKTEATFNVSIVADGISEDTETLELEIGAYTLRNMFLVQQGENAVLSLSIENCATCVTCDWTMDMQDGYGDGWNNGVVTFDMGGTLTDFTLASGASGQHIISVPDATNITITHTAGDWEGEITYQIYDANGVLVVNAGDDSSNNISTAPATGIIHQSTNACP